MTIPEIIAEVVRVTEIPATEITGKRRSKSIVWAKFILAREIRREKPHWSLMQIALAAGSDQHATIIHRLKQAEWLYVTQPDFRRLTDQLFTPTQPKQL